LFFCPDMKGYGWCFRKGNFLNIGLGRADSHGLPGHVGGFVEFLTARGVSPEMPAMRGHAYFLGGTSQRPAAGDGFLLIGDSAGLAYPQSGEGILPAIESGLLAAETILAARGTYTESRLAPYAVQLAKRYGATGDWLTGIAAALPPGLIRVAAKQLMETRWFVRDFVLDSWFLHQ
jgi:flavin-dependent dehydrogenase